MKLLEITNRDDDKDITQVLALDRFFSANLNVTMNSINGLAYRNIVKKKQVF